jgi:hypothetical protein
MPHQDLDSPDANPHPHEKILKHQEPPNKIPRIPMLIPRTEEPLTGNSKLGRHFDLQDSIDVNKVLERLLNLQVPITVGEALALKRNMQWSIGSHPT